MEIEESWMDKIRNFSAGLREAEESVHRWDAEIKKILALKKTEALGDGCKTSASQERYAEAQPEVYQARINFAKAKGHLAAVRCQLKAIEIGFEEWRTRVVTAREERKRYGA